MPESNANRPIDSKFRFVLIAANRAEQLMRGARPKADGAGRKPTVAAMREVERDLVEWAYGPRPEAQSDGNGSAA